MNSDLELELELEKTDNNESELTPDDLIYYTDKSGEIKAGGYSINSKFLKENKPVMVNGGGKKEKNINLSVSNVDGKPSDKLNNMVVPAGLVYLQQSLRTPYSDYGQIEVCEMKDAVPDDLYSRLLNLVEIKSTPNINLHIKKLSRRKKKNTKRNKKY